MVLLSGYSRGFGSSDSVHTKVREQKETTETETANAAGEHDSHRVPGATGCTGAGTRKPRVECEIEEASLQAVGGGLCLASNHSGEGAAPFSLRLSGTGIRAQAISAKPG